MGVDIYYSYHGFGLKAFEGRHNIINYKSSRNGNIISYTVC